MPILCLFPIENIGYNVLARCGEKIIGDFAKDSKTLAFHLHTKKFISDVTLEETNELNEINRNKARRLYTTVLGTVRQHPQRYVDLISILESNETLYKDLLEELKLTYIQLSRHE